MKETAYTDKFGRPWKWQVASAINGYTIEGHHTQKAAVHAAKVMNKHNYRVGDPERFFVRKA